MRIQDMRSGIEHLGKKVEAQTEQNDDHFWPDTTAAAPRQAVAEAETPAEIPSDLNAPQWSVVSFRRREAGGLTHSQAVELMEFLDGRGVYGLCIITDDAAVRYSAKEVR